MDDYKKVTWDEWNNLMSRVSNLEKLESVIAELEDRLDELESEKY